MSGRIVGEVLDNAPADLTQLEMLILVALAEEARDGDRKALYNTTSEALAFRARSTPASVRNALARLKQRGLVIPLHAKVYKGKAQQYQIPKMNKATRSATWT